MALEEEQEPGVPEWVVTFGDMMSLLLTFFIMLVSMSEIKEEEQFQAMVESMKQQFGHEASVMAFVPGEQQPRNSNMKHIASQGRAKRLDTARGGDKVKAPVGENAQVQIIRSGKNTTVGGMIFFEKFRMEISEKSKQQLQRIVQQVAGKPQRIEVRGYTVLQPVPKDSGFQDNWDLANQRSRVVMEFLVSQGVSQSRISMNNFGPNEPVYIGVNPAEQGQNARVHVVMVDERTTASRP